MKAVALTVFEEDDGERKDEAKDQGKKQAESGSDAESGLKTGTESLPPSWEKHESKSNPGLFYYFNSETGETVWTAPKVQTENEKNKIEVSPVPTEEKEVSSNIHLEDIPIAPPAGATGIIPSPRPKHKVTQNEEDEPILLKKTHSHLDHAKAMARNPDHMNKSKFPDNYCAKLSKSMVAEFLGTYFLCSTYALGANQASSHMAPLAFGLTIVAMTFAFGHVSGAHFNPAVTVAVFLRGKIDLLGSILYVVAQLAGAFCGAGQQLLVASDSGFTSAYPSLGQDVSWYTGIATEFSYTFALVTVFLNCATTKAQQGNSFFGLAIGMIAAAAGWSATPISGGVFNPALGTAMPIVHGHYSGFWIYWAGPILGGAIASGVFRLTADPSEFENEKD